jgi:hypothetical protein
VGGHRSGSGGSSAGGSPAGQSAGGSAGAAQGGGGAGAGATGGDGAECVLAQTVACCPSFAPVTRAELEASECLVAVGEEPAPGERERCGATLCPEIECAYVPLPSRVLEPDGNGGCRYADECDTVSDCQVAIDCCTCCACEDQTPRALVSQGLCFIPTRGQPLPDAERPAGCRACPADCVACPRRDGELSCNPTPEGLKRCEWGPPLTASHCTNDRPCVNRFAGQNMRCYAPDDTYCAGPPPLPDECAEDVDCQTDATREHFVCEPSGHCGMRACAPGCLSEDDCSVAEQCEADHRCAPKPCASEVCGDDHFCSNGVCTRKTCSTSLRCGGYCVNGFCYSAPGNCQDANAP